MSNYRNNFQPKRPVKSFQDLEVYQKSQALAVTLTKRIHGISKLAEGEEKEDGGRDGSPKAGSISAVEQSITQHLLTNALAIPVAVATAHSRRFGGPVQAIEKVEEAMLRCNLCVVYLDEYRDLVNDNVIEHEFFEEQVKAYLALRGKLLRLQRSWQKFMSEDRISA